MPDADDVALADEEVRLAEGDAAVDQLRGAGNDEQRVAILLELGPRVRVLGVVDGKVVQVELALHSQQQLAVGLQEADPDDVPLLAGPVARLLDGDVGHALAGTVDAGGDNARLGGALAGKAPGMFHQASPKRRAALRIARLCRR